MGSVCYLSMGMVVLLMGLVFASVYIYRYFFLAQVRPARGSVHVQSGCGRWQERAVSTVESQGLGVCEERQQEALNLPHPPQVGGVPGLAQNTCILPPLWGLLGLRTGGHP